MSVSRKLSLLGVLLSLAGCQTTTPTAVTDTSCIVFKPIHYRRTDSNVTEVRGHNASWDAICKGQ
jgi:hypothetical protein